MPAKIRPKLCYVIPDYRKDDSTHFFHIHDFLGLVSKDFDLAVVALRGSLPDKRLGYEKAYLIHFNNPIFRFVEIKILFLFLRFSGYKDFYIHYSFEAAFISSVITRFLGGRTFYWNCGEPWKYKRRLLREAFERITYKLVSFVVTGAESLVSKYAETYRLPREKIKIMPNWIGLRRFNLPRKNKEIHEELQIPIGMKIVLFIHHLSKRKGSNMILPIAREVTKFHPDSRFVVIGSGPDSQNLSEAINKDPSLSRFVRLEGSVPNSKIPKYLSCADVLLMPSEEEGFPRVILESMASGIPFVASRVGAVGDIIPINMKEFVVTAGDVCGFVEKINLVLSLSKSKKELMRNELMIHSHEYDLPKVVEEFKKIIKDING